MRALSLNALRPLLCAGVLLLGGCDTLWGSFKDGNEQNCQKNPTLCSDAQVCNPATRVCEDKCQSSQQCTMASGRPLCLNGACVPCDMVTDVDSANRQCAGRGVMGSQVCVRSGANKGQCLGCDTAADCSNDSFVCNSKNVCAEEPCASNAACKSGVCDPYQMVAGTPGRCVSTADLVYVNNKNGGACTSGDGTSPDKGLCTLAEGVQRAAMMSKKGIRIVGSTKDYGSLQVGTAGARFGGTLTIYGPAGAGVNGEEGRAQIGRRVAENGASFALADGAVVALDGVEIGGALVGVDCDGVGSASLAVHRTQVLTCEDAGVRVNSCSLGLDRSLISGNKKGALLLTSSKSYRLTNNVIAGNRAVAGSPIKISGDSAGLFAFNTVVNNVGGAGAAGGIDCDNVSRTLQDSIFFGNIGAASQFFQSCTLDRVVIGASAQAMMGAIVEDPVFVDQAGGDFRLKTDDAKNTSCCIDKAGNRDIKSDYFGTARPQGQGPDIGAHEAK